MVCKAGAKKKQPVKALGIKDLAVMEVTATSSARRAAIGKRATRGKVSVASSDDTGPMLATAANRELTSTATDAAATLSTSQDQSSEVAILQAQLAAMKHDLKTAQEAASAASSSNSSNTKDKQVGRPKKIGSSLGFWQ